MEKLVKLFEKEYGYLPEVKRLKGGGSEREYFRLHGPDVSVIGVESEDHKDNEAFFSLDRIFETAGIRVPHIIRISEDRRCYLQEDLGDILLLDILNAENRLKLGKNSLDDLISIQTLPANLWENAVEYPSFSERLARWDLNYFKYDFLKPAGIPFDEEALEDDFEKLTGQLISGNMIYGFMYRDFQARNIMVNDNLLYYIDFQGGRKGPVVYDAVSFIWQAKAPFTFEERENLEQYYVTRLSQLTKKAQEEITRQLTLMKVFRTLQVLGAYGFRGLIQKKSHFLESIPLAVANLCLFKEKGLLKDYPEVEKTADRLAEKYLSRYNQEKEEGLTVRVYSFSYKKGYPEDETGNGGGFMFDCRGLDNPGRYEPYKHLTGMDLPVINFLEDRKETEEFIKNALNIVKPTIERYRQRGFTSLQIGFGCTGGQHRSVYCAEKLAEKLKLSIPELRVEIIHREQDIKRVYR